MLFQPHLILSLLLSRKSVISTITSNALLLSSSSNKTSKSTCTDTDTSTPSSILEAPIINNLNQDESSISLSLAEAVHLIKNETPPLFLRAVKRTEGKLLYRGEEMIESSSPLRMKPQPDLLQPGTYPDGENDLALNYFSKLEACITSLTSPSLSRNNKDFVVLPSNGHIATPLKSEASKWGVPVSIWPIGHSLSFAYPQNRLCFIDSDMDEELMAMMGGGSGGNRLCNGDIRIDNYGGLEEALRLGHEIMFATQDGPSGIVSSEFVAVPSRFDNCLKSMLDL